MAWDPSGPPETILSLIIYIAFVFLFELSDILEYPMDYTVIVKIPS